MSGAETEHDGPPPNGPPSEEANSAEAEAHAEDAAAPSQPSPQPSPQVPIGGTVTIRLETLANILTAAVAISAILLSVWEGVENRRHNRLSVLPHLQLAEMTMSSATPIENENFLLPSNLDSLLAVTYVMENTGLGPAVVQGVRVYKDGENVFETTESEGRYYPGQLRRNLQQMPFTVHTLQQPISREQMLKAGDRHIMFTAFAPFAGINPDSLERTSPLGMMKEQALAGRSVVVCYCSVYGENCDQAHFGEEPPEADVCDF